MGHLVVPIVNVLQTNAREFVAVQFPIPVQMRPDTFLGLLLAELLMPRAKQTGGLVVVAEKLLFLLLTDSAFSPGSFSVNVILTIKLQLDY